MLIHGVCGFIQKGLEMSQKDPVGSRESQVCPGHPQRDSEGSEDVPERTCRVWGVLRWVPRDLLSTGRVWR